jgi:aldehyde:ferredoxin oxidoreductase
MGSKRLKALAVRGDAIVVADYGAFMDAYREYRHRLDPATSRDPWTPAWSTYGAPVLARLFAENGNLMTRNAQEMRWGDAKAKKVGAEVYLDRYVTKAKACFGCPWPACQKIHTIPSGKYQGFKGGNYWAGQPVVFGSLIDNDDLDLALVLSGLCNRYGLDIFHVGFTLAWAMECFENGLLSKADTGGLELRFGCPDPDGLIDLVRKIALREGFGALLALGCSEAAKIVGQGSERFCLSVKGQELEAIAERSMYMVALGVATSEVGPDHTRWYPPYPCNPNLMSSEELQALGIELDLQKAFQGRNPDEKGKMLRWFSISRAVVESLPGVRFPGARHAWTGHATMAAVVPGSYRDRAGLQRVLAGRRAGTEPRPGVHRAGGVPARGRSAAGTGDDRNCPLLWLSPHHPGSAGRHVGRVLRGQRVGFGHLNPHAREAERAWTGGCGC